ncbi:HDOD domain-containing protein [Zoogloea sp.]|uniref:HDOD domain-containing protein n=1 Tax=Zoogloea sp. TaxID=49181 RepID=UPI001AD2E93A|nr:HDOD domain-containing protein [Zoogloea sp.]MBN8283231.1 HDOD domain-containing protein [Zoogloea sp.]
MTRLEEMVSHVQKLPAMPVVAMEVLQSMSGTDTDIDALAKRIAQDQAIAARVLRVANSPFYGLQSKVGSIHDAIVVLGLSSVRSLVLAAAVITGLPGGRCPDFSQSRFWRHVLGVAAAARALARPLRRPPEPLFVAGLLHDIGRLAMMTIYPEDLCRVLAEVQARDCTLLEAERRHFGFDHARVGAELARRWNFPADIVDALAWHHDPAQGIPGGLAGIVHYADAIAHALDLDGAATGQVPRLDAQTVDALDLGWEALNGVLTETRAGFDSFETLLG